MIGAWWFSRSRSKPDPGRPRVRHHTTRNGMAKIRQDMAIDHILSAPGFSDEERRAMLGETAAKLLGIAP